jgi:hypothetical protein
MSVRRFTAACAWALVDGCAARRSWRSSPPSCTLRHSHRGRDQMRLVHDAHLVARHGADTMQVKGLVRQRQHDGQRIVVTCSAPPSQPLLCRAARNPRYVAERFVDSPLNRRQTGHGVRAPPGCDRAECTQMTERGSHLQRHGHALDTCLAASHVWRTWGRSISNPTAFFIALGQVSRAVECSCVVFLLNPPRLQTSPRCRGASGRTDTACSGPVLRDVHISLVAHLVSNDSRSQNSPFNSMLPTQACMAIATDHPLQVICIGVPMHTCTCQQSAGSAKELCCPCCEHAHGSSPVQSHFLRVDALRTLECGQACSGCG